MSTKQKGSQKAAAITLKITNKSTPPQTKRERQQTFLKKILTTPLAATQ